MSGSMAISLTHGSAETYMKENGRMETCIARAL